jgi:hypothetical protein
VLYDICEEARNHGIGVIVAEKPDDYDTWNEPVIPDRHNPDPARLDDFIKKQFSSETAARVAYPTVLRGVASRANAPRESAGGTEATTRGHTEVRQHRVP